MKRSKLPEIQRYKVLVTHLNCLAHLVSSNFRCHFCRSFILAWLVFLLDGFTMSLLLSSASYILVQYAMEETFRNASTALAMHRKVCSYLSLNSRQMIANCNPSGVVVYFTGVVSFKLVPCYYKNSFGILKYYTFFTNLLAF